MKLFIGCSAKENIDSGYLEDCLLLLQEISTIPDLDLVYGSCNTGLSKQVYQFFFQAGKKITGVITEYHKKMAEEDSLGDQEIVVSTTTERFQKIYENCDMILFLPGGLGTYAEIFSAIEEQRIQNGKKIILYNDRYFYTPIIKELYHLHQEGFIDEVPADYMVIESDKDKIVELLKEEMKSWKN